jgi:uncharacterized protein with PIN domain
VTASPEAAALLHTRKREITDTLVDLLISTVHRINARVDKRVTRELVNAFKKVTGGSECRRKIACVSLACGPRCQRNPSQYSSEVQQPARPA